MSAEGGKATLRKRRLRAKRASLRFGALRHVAAVAALASGACSGRTAVVCPAPVPSWIRSPTTKPGHTGANILTMSSDGVPRWNRARTSWNELERYLRLVAEMTPQPVTIFRPTADAPCAEVIRVRELMSRRLPCGAGACGEGPQWSDFTDPSGFDI